MKVIEKDLVWGELNLDGLLGDPAANSSSLDRQVLHSMPPGKKKIILKHQKMVRKPTFHAVMERYQSAPNKPKMISKSKLDRLADPILGRLNHRYEKFLEETRLSISPRPSYPEVGGDEEGVFSLTAAAAASPAKTSSALHSHVRSGQSPNKSPSSLLKDAGGGGGNGFFLTAGEDRLDPIVEGSPGGARSRRVAQGKAQPSRLGFAAALRKEIKQVDRKVRNLSKPVVPQQDVMMKKTRTGPAAGGSQNRFIQPRQVRAKPNPISKAIQKDPLVQRLKKVKSSGYGRNGGNSNLPNKATNNNSLTSATARHGMGGRQPQRMANRKALLTSSTAPNLMKPLADKRRTVSSQLLRSRQDQQQTSAPSLLSVPAPTPPAPILPKQESKFRQRLGIPSRNTEQSPSPIKSPKAVKVDNEASSGSDAPAVSASNHGDAYSKKRSTVTKSVAALYRNQVHSQRYQSSYSPSPPSSSPRKTSQGDTSPKTTAPDMNTLKMLRPGQTDHGEAVIQVSQSRGEKEQAATADAASTIMINAEPSPDLEATMAKLRKYEKHSSSSAKESSRKAALVEGPQVDNSTLYTKGDVEATFAKHALRLGSTINHAENRLKEYTDLRNALE
eukprot:gene10091-11171_t